jgi:hypothetical protein
VGELLAQVGPEQIEDVKSAWEQSYGQDGSLKSVLQKRLGGGE